MPVPFIELVAIAAETPSWVEFLGKINKSFSNRSISREDAEIVAALSEYPVKITKTNFHTVQGYIVPKECSSKRYAVDMSGALEFVDAQEVMMLDFIDFKMGKIGRG